MCAFTQQLRVEHLLCAGHHDGLVSGSSQEPALMGTAVAGGDRRDSSLHYADQTENCTELQGFDKEVRGTNGTNRDLTWPARASLRKNGRMSRK